MKTKPLPFLNTLFEVAVNAAMPGDNLISELPQHPKGKTIVIGAGKAAASMAKTVEDNWNGPLTGLVITRYQHGLDLQKIRVVEAGHPVPDDAGQKAADEILDLVKGLTKDDLVICLISGGGSSLLSKPADGITLEDKKAINKSLLACGANIQEMNTVRKKFSAIKGGQLALAAFPAKVVSYLISDVPGDDPSVIASGPTVYDDTSVEDAFGILDKYGIPISTRLKDAIYRHSELASAIDHSAFENTEYIMIATPQDALQAAAAQARKAGITPLILGDSLEGEAKDVALVLASITRQVLDHDEPVKKPCVILSGGETTVTISDKASAPGRGGRNAEFLLAFANAMNGAKGVYALAADTDGIDGSEDNAGAVYDPETIDRAIGSGVDPKDHLARHDAYSFFEKLDDLIITGPTRTNVNDFRAILILPEK